MQRGTLRSIGASPGIRASERYFCSFESSWQEMSDGIACQVGLATVSTRGESGEFELIADVGSGLTGLTGAIAGGALRGIILRRQKQ
jgi:hypothetical protein